VTRRLATLVSAIAPILLLASCATGGTDAAGAGAASLLGTALLLGIRHGIDWDHIAAIVDITSTTAAAEAAEAGHRDHHRSPGARLHEHGGVEEATAHRAEEMSPGPHAHPPPAARDGIAREQRRAILLGTLYAIGHALVVAILGLAALAFGTLLPDWVDPIMGRVVGITLIVLGIWVFYSIYQYARHGHEFRLRSRWMLVFDGVRLGWRRLMAWLHGHEHVEPIEMSAYGTGTALGVGMIHGIGAETGSQVLIIAAVGGAASLGLGVPMMLAFIAGLLISNTAIIVLSATGFVASQLRQRIYLAVGAVAGVFSLVIGAFFLFAAEGALPDLTEAFRFIGG
jgi:hypothetical protein